MDPLIFRILKLATCLTLALSSQSVFPLPIDGGAPRIAAPQYQLPAIRRVQTLLDNGNLQGAEKRLEKLIRKYERRDQRISLSIALEVQADLRRRQNRPTDSLALFRRAQELAASNPATVKRLQNEIQALELEKFEEFKQEYPPHQAPYDDFIKKHPDFTILASVRRERDLAFLHCGKTAYSQDPSTAETWLLDASTSEFDDIRTEGRALLLSLQPDFQDYLAEARSIENLVDRASFLRNASLNKATQDPRLASIYEDVIADELEQVEFLLFVVQRGDPASIQKYLRIHGASFAMAPESKKRHLLSVYARSVGKPFALAALAETFGLSHPHNESTLKLTLSKGFAGGSDYWFELRIDHAPPESLGIPYRRQGQRGEMWTYSLERGVRNITLYMVEESYPLFQSPQIEYHPEASLQIQDKVTPLFNYVGVMDRNTGMKLCVKKVPAFAGYEDPGVQEFLAILKEYSSTELGEASEVCPAKSLPSPLTLGDLKHIAENVVGPSLGVGVQAVSTLLRDYAQQNNEYFSDIGQLLLITGSICGEGTVSIKGPVNKELKCCGWGNLGTLSHPLPPGSYSLSMTVSTCTGSIHKVTDVDFLIQPRITTEIELHLDSGSYVARVLADN